MVSKTGKKAAEAAGPARKTTAGERHTASRGSCACARFWRAAFGDP